MKRAILTLALLLWAVPTPCRADEPAETPALAQARQSFERGLELAERGEHRAALGEFQRAHELAPSYRIFYNIGLVNVALGDPAAAITAFRRYLREGAAGVPGDRRKEVEREIARLSQRVAALIVNVDQAGATIAIDGQPVGTSPLAGRAWLNPGRHRVDVSADGKSRAQELELAAGDELVVRFELAQKPATEPPRREPEVEPAPTASESRVPWLAWGITGALAAGAGVTGVVALSARNNEVDLQEKEGVGQSELVDARSDVERWALVSDLFLAATAVSAGVALYLTLKPAEDDKPAAVLIVAPRGVAARFAF